MGRDYAYEPMVSEVAEAAHNLPLSDAAVAARILEDIRNDKTWPLEKRLTAAYDLAMVEQSQGRNFEALDLLEDVLRQSEAKLRQVIDLVPHFIFAKNRRGEFVLVNEAVAKAYGTTVEELLGKVIF